MTGPVQMIIRFGFLMIAASTINFTSAADASDPRLPTTVEVLELAEHLRKYPPWISDVTILVEFDLKPIEELTLRKQVRRSIELDNIDRGLPTSGDDVDAEIEREVQRLLIEQQLPRRIKERWRRHGLSYRVDEVHTQTGLEVIDEDTPWKSSFLYLFDEETGTADTARFDYPQKIISVFGPRHDYIQQNRDAWEGGTLGRISEGLRDALGMNKFAETAGDPDLKLVEQLVEGTHPYLQLIVVDFDGKHRKREFLYRPVNGGEIRFTTPAESFEPVLEFVATDDDQSLTFSLTAEQVDKDGVVTMWTEKKPNPRDGKLKEIHYTLLSRTIGGTLPDDTFATDRIDGWTHADHRPETTVVVGPDGGPVNVAPRPDVPSPPTNHWNLFGWILWATGMLIVFLTFLFGHRGRIQKTSDP